jgi:hypothetical protein
LSPDCEDSGYLPRAKPSTTRGPDIQQDARFSTVSPDARAPKDHPLRPIRTMVDAALKELDRNLDVPRYP